jgi:hypothetical protein
MKLQEVVIKYDTLNVKAVACWGRRLLLMYDILRVYAKPETLKSGAPH